MSQGARGHYARKLLNDLMEDYSNALRPVGDTDKALNVSLQITLSQIKDMVSGNEGKRPVSNLQTRPSASFESYDECAANLLQMKTDLQYERLPHKTVPLKNAIAMPAIDHFNDKFAHHCCRMMNVHVTLFLGSIEKKWLKAKYFLKRDKKQKPKPTVKSIFPSMLNI